MLHSPITRRSGVWIEPPYQKWLEGAATVTVTAYGKLKIWFKAAATVSLTGTATLEQTFLVATPTVSLTGSATLEQTFLVATPTVSLTGSATLEQTFLVATPTISITAASSDTIFRGLILDPDPRTSWAIYRAYMIKTGEDDLELPISSFNATTRDGESSYISINVPNPGDYLTALEDYSGGQIAIKSGFVDATTGVETLYEIGRVDWDYFRYDLGAYSGTATLSGHATTSARAPITRELQGISYKSVTDGVMTVRCQPDMYLLPGDTADLGDGETFTVDSISYTITTSLAYMEVGEAEE